MISGREQSGAVLVPGHQVTFAELQLSAFLGLTLLGADPKNVDLLSAKSGMYRLVQSSNLPQPSHALDLYDMEEFYAQLAKLVYRFPHIPKWILKIDDEFRCKGSAVFNLHKDRL